MAGFSGVRMWMLNLLFWFWQDVDEGEASAMMN